MKITMLVILLFVLIVIIIGIQHLIENKIITINQTFEDKVTNFAITGDFAVNDATKKNLQNIASIDPEIFLAVGDLRNDNGPPQGWFEMTEFLGKDRIHVALGNHDVQGDEVEQYLNYYGLEQEFYSFDYENVHFIVLATDTSIKINSEQFNFLKTDLQNARENPNVDWIIVGLHRTIYSDGKHITAYDYKISRNYDHTLYWRTVTQPLFDFYQVDLVLQGHNQFYERFYPLKFNQIVTDNEFSNYVDPEGQLYVTVGTGGHRLHTPVKKSDISVIQTNEFFGFLNLELSSDGKTMSGKFLNLDMDIIDNFQITKQKDYFNPNEKLLENDLSGKDLSNSNLAMFDFSGTDLSYTILRNADLTYADLSYTKLIGADLRGANMHGVNLEGVDLSGLDLTGANLSLVNMSRMDLSDVILEETTLFGTSLVDTDLSGKNFSGVNLSMSDFTRTNFTETNLSYADLSTSFMNFTKFKNTNLQNANLSNSLIFLDNKFNSSDITDANLQNSLFYLEYFNITDSKVVNLSG